MNWFWANWYHVNAGVAVLAASILAAYWNHFDLVQRCIIANFAVMNLHHWEEFGFPGGFTGLCNIARYGSDRPAHYPLNQLIAAFGNNWFNYIVYLPPLFLPKVTFLTLCPMAFGLLEVFGHGVLMNALVRRPYNPGLATSIFGFLPVGVTYLQHAHSNNLISGLDWLLAFMFAMANYYVIFYHIGIGYMGSKTTPYAFTKEEMDRYNPSLWSPSVWLAYYRDNWYYFTAIAFVISTFVMGFFGNLFTRIQTILIYNLMALFVHQVEEYILPGGGPLVINVAFYGERKDYDRFPGNKLSMAWVNTLAYPFYISAVVFPDNVWLGLAQCFFGFFQVIGHGLVMNIKANTAYNPDVASALLLHLPIGIYYIAHVHDHQLIQAVDWIYGLGGFILASILTIVIPILSCRNRQSSYPLTAKEMAGFNLLNKYRAKGLLKTD
ncbi:hypothetical protein PFICI_14958 [Pestalotiopsis fici W106-1]|uniref:Uncharacterized protein n=1 Tax=Pestalotiopsis fici (strain W106-1 / CGMCC3.15140) TaxID=1229662 RepID=W3WHI3_PESFW|nr:uncharacterized protein PFICI_14958 [Pestalotiopsis fici W106-1]ETS73353.1 hypothetical protein PFICI_14958 [Pestalotiopsis fici W106-1]